MACETSGHTSSLAQGAVRKQAHMARHILLMMPKMGPTFWNVRTNAANTAAATPSIKPAFSKQHGYNTQRNNEQYKDHTMHRVIQLAMHTGTLAPCAPSASTGAYMPEDVHAFILGSSSVSS